MVRTFAGLIGGELMTRSTMLVAALIAVRVLSRGPSARTPTPSRSRASRTSSSTSGSPRWSRVTSPSRHRARPVLLGAFLKAQTLLATATFALVAALAATGAVSGPRLEGVDRAGDGRRGDLVPVAPVRGDPDRPRARRAADGHASRPRHGAARRHGRGRRVVEDARGAVGGHGGVGDDRRGGRRARHHAARHPAGVAGSLARPRSPAARGHPLRAARRVQRPLSARGYAHARLARHRRRGRQLRRRVAGDGDGAGAAGVFRERLPGHGRSDGSADTARPRADRRSGAQRAAALGPVRRRACLRRSPRWSSWRRDRTTTPRAPSWRCSVR